MACMIIKNFALHTGPLVPNFFFTYDPFKQLTRDVDFITCRAPYTCALQNTFWPTAVAGEAGMHLTLSASGGSNGVTVRFAAIM